MNAIMGDVTQQGGIGNLFHKTAMIITQITIEWVAYNRHYQTLWGKEIHFRRISIDTTNTA
jgi:hypothetical protein